MITRRRFVAVAAASSSFPWIRRAWGAAPDLSPSVQIHTDQPLAKVPADFTGLSYESSQLAHPDFFSPKNRDLISLFRTLGVPGVLRIGGNMSEFTQWSPEDLPADASTDGVEGPDANAAQAPAKNFIITPAAIRNLNAFLEATGWKLLYGLKLAHGTAEDVAEEAAFVSQTIGPRLLAFQIGNEPDLFNHGTTKDRKERWTYEEYIARWQQVEQVLRARVPTAPLAGPDVSFSADWARRLANDEGAKLSLITSHYYAGGPPTDPAMDIPHLLNTQTHPRTQIADDLRYATAAGLPYRLAESNSCYHGGKDGVSNTFASALWSADLMCQVAALGAAGVNFHGGGDGLYTPIAGSRSAGFTARPMYYGMLLARALAGSTLYAVTTDNPGADLTTYAASKDGQWMALVFNKGEQSTDVALRLPEMAAAKTRLTRATITRLTAPSITAKTDVRLGDAAVSPTGQWKSRSTEVVHARSHSFSVPMPAYSAALVQFQR